MNSLKVGACMCVAHVSGVGCTVPRALSNSKLAFSLCAEGCDFLPFIKSMCLCACVYTCLVLRVLLMCVWAAVCLSEKPVAILRGSQGEIQTPVEMADYTFGFLLYQCYP